MKNQDIPAVIIFGLCLITRAAMQGIGGPEIGDVSWITTFGAIGASWLGITARVSQVQKNTNGVLTKNIEDTVDAAVSRVLDSRHGPTQ